MNRRLLVLMTSVIFAGSVALAAPEPVPTPTPQPVAADQPEPKRPLRFSAFAVSNQQGQAGQIDIAIERWTTDAERKGLLELVAGAEFRTGGQDKLLQGLQKIEPRVGFIRTPTSMGWDLKYAWQSALPDGTRQIVIATDKPVGVLSATTGSRVLDYPFTLIEIRMGKDDKGEGRLLAATAVSVKDGKLALEAYGLEPVKLTSITETQKKAKPPKEE